MPDPFGWLFNQNLDYFWSYNNQVEPGYKCHPIQFMVDFPRPFGTIEDHLRPYSTFWGHFVPFGTISDILGIYLTILDNVGSLWIALDHLGSFGTIWDNYSLYIYLETSLSTEPNTSQRTALHCTAHSSLHILQLAADFHLCHPNWRKLRPIAQGQWLHCTALHYTALHYTALYCTALLYKTLQCTALQDITVAVMHCTIL